VCGRRMTDRGGGGGVARGTQFYSRVAGADPDCLGTAERKNKTRSQVIGGSFWTRLRTLPKIKKTAGGMGKNKPGGKSRCKKTTKKDFATQPRVSKHGAVKNRWRKKAAHWV